MGRKSLDLLYRVLSKVAYLLTFIREMMQKKVAGEGEPLKPYEDPKNQVQVVSYPRGHKSEYFVLFARS